MSKSYFGMLLIVFVLLAVAATHAQSPGKYYRVGYLSVRSEPSPLDDVFKAALKEKGFVEGQNLSILYRWANEKPEQFPALAAELVKLNVDVIGTETTPATLAVKNATSTIPIVMVLTGDAVAAGLVASLAHPGANVTGLTFIGPDLAGKWVELLREMSPKISRVAYLANPDLPPETMVINAMQPVSQRLGVALRSFAARNQNDFESAFASIKQANCNGLVVSPNVVYVQNRRQIVELAASHRIPAIYGRSEFVESGGLASYGTSFPDLYRRAADFVDKILKGRKPADLPVEQPMKFEFVVNLKTAKAIGLIIPPNVLVRADRVIR